MAPFELSLYTPARSQGSLHSESGCLSRELWETREESGDLGRPRCPSMPLEEVRLERGRPSRVALFQLPPLSTRSALTLSRSLFSLA